MRKWARNVLLFGVAVLAVFGACLLCFSYNYGAELRRAAYSGDFLKAQSILKAHPEVIDSYQPHPEALSKEAQRKRIRFSKALRIRLSWARLRYLLRQVGYQRVPTPFDGWDELGCSPLDLAVVGNHPEIVSLLLDHGADYSHVSAGNMIALNEAIRRGNLEIVNQFLAHRCNLEVPSASGSTALCEAVLQQNAQIAALLLAHGAKVDGGPDQAPLQMAALINSKAMAELLIAHGAEVNVTNRWKETPLAIAARLSHGETAACLRDHGAR